MKKILSIGLAFVLCLALFAGCKTETPTVTQKENSENVIYPLHETLDMDSLDNCTVAVCLEKGDAYADESGKMFMKLKVYSYELYDMADVSSLEEDDVIVRHNEEVKITKLERLDSGLVRINGGEENGGFDLFADDSTVYYEIGMNDLKSYYELGQITLPVSNEFEYTDKSDFEAEPKIYYPGDFLADNSDIEYNFFPSNTSVVIKDGTVIKMDKVYVP